MSKTIISGAKIFDGSGDAAFVGDVVVVDGKVSSVIRGTGTVAHTDGEVIDGSGLFLMPGMTEGHGHLSFENVAATADLIKPAEELSFVAMRNAKRLLDAGFTSVYGASEARMRLAVGVRNEINAGRLPGPRIRAGSIEYSCTGAMGDEGMTHDPRPGGPAMLVDGPEEMRKAVRIACREGVDNIKLDVSGDPFYPSTPGHTTPMSYEEVEMAVKTAHDYGRQVCVHTRSIEGSKHCVKAGVDVIFHVEYSDEELLDMIEARKDNILVVPTVGLFHSIVNNEAAGAGLTAEIGGYMGIPGLLEASCATHTELRKRGVKHLIGGDYGFAWAAHGTNARDLKFFEDYYGYTPEGALACATGNGGFAMTGQGGDLGKIAEGYLADMLLIDGDPTKDLNIIPDTDRIVMVMKGGELYKNTINSAARRVAA